MTKKVLSIDMDYVMSPCINLYNDCAGSEEFRKGNFWEQLNAVRGIDKYLEYDSKKFLTIVQLMGIALRRLGKECFFFAREHDMILEFLCGDEKKKDERFEVWNVDHHHDIFYNPRQKEEVDRFDFACLANWVYYMGKHEKLYKYHWVKNENSMPFVQREHASLTFPFVEETDINKIAEVDFDYVFVCQSKEYFPDKYQHLFYTLLEMATHVKAHEYEVWNKEFCIDGKSRVPVK